jgi:hypothetical protein
LSDRELGVWFEMLKQWRASLPASAVALVDVLDRLRELPVAALAERCGVSVAEVEAEMAAQLGEGGIHG